MAKAMTKSQILTTLAGKTDMSKKQASLFMTELANLAYKEAKRGFTIPGLGKLVVVNRKARWGRNPQTGERIRIKAKRVLKFRISKVAKDAVMG
ncbi:MAG: HU family DNA-binding protein [Planctomycetota bacterium]|jgi:DNA-binding protein HU-beta